MIWIQVIVFLALLLYASYSDLKTREISPWIPISITITGFIGITPTALPLMFLSAMVVTVPQLLVAGIKKDSYGGGDIKFMAACAFMLGPEGGCSAIIIGLSVGLLTTVIKRKLKKESLKEKFPIVPCLAFGSFLSFLIFSQGGNL
ncbi:MAG: A24 family peptidase [Ethanoligenens sp.]